MTDFERDLRDSLRQHSTYFIAARSWLFGNNEKMKYSALYVPIAGVEHFKVFVAVLLLYCVFAFMMHK